MSPEDMARMKQMVRDLNQMLSEKMHGGEPDFDGFMQKYGDLFGDNPPQTLDELIEQMQQPDRRRCRACSTACPPTCASSSRTC